jgi:hypothetical protein
MIRGGVLCKQHRKELAEALRELVNGMYVLGEMSLRRVRIGGIQGHANPAFAPSPISESDQDLYTQVEDVLQEAAATIGYWDHPDMAGLLRGLLLRLDRLCSHPECGTTFKRVTRAALKVEERTTPPEERIIYGRCLNPVCLRQVTGVRGQTEATCGYCGSVWSVTALFAERHRRMLASDRTGTATGIAMKLQREGYKIKAATIRQWVHRNRLFACGEVDGDPVYRVRDVAGIIELRATQSKCA